MNSSLTFAAGQYRLGGHVIGTLRGDRLHKLVRDEHMLHRPRKAWSFDLGMLLDAQARGAHLVEVRHMETGQMWVADIAAFFTRGWAVNFGYGEQRALALEHWRTGDAQRPPTAVPVQLGFAFS